MILLTKYERLLIPDHVTIFYAVLIFQFVAIYVYICVLGIAIELNLGKQIHIAIKQRKTFRQCGKRGELIFCAREHFKITRQVCY